MDFKRENKHFITSEHLINLTCRWLDKFHSRYAAQKSDGSLYVEGTCQTDLRAFLNSVCERDDDDYYEIIERLNNGDQNFA